ncbi:MAG: hypothetical protein GXP11_09585 [Gammaproteobacteria bacterium]|nr:hypothetical protein [Gammaproteobacteria bacterium]
MAQQGEGVVTQDMFSARAAKIPAAVRQEVLRNSTRFQDILNALLLNAQLAADARKAGFDRQAMAVNRMQLAAEGELARAWLQYYVEIQPDADYEQLAREYYLLNPEEFRTPEMVDVSQILVSTKERTEPEALELATTLYQQLVQDPSLFDQFITQYSEDPSAASNQGKFTGVKKGDMVKPFEDTAFALKNGEISAPVKSKFGYHIIRLDEHIVPKIISFDKEKPRLIENARKRHKERLRRNYINSLKSQKVEISESALEEMISRLFGEDTHSGGDVDSE